ncbi:hypothetical protein ACA910_007267 [Epithemia clementina (nom. ined.)]
MPWSQLSGRWWDGRRESSGDADSTAVAPSNKASEGSIATGVLVSRLDGAINRIPGRVSITLHQHASSNFQTRFAWDLDLVKNEKTKEVVVRGLRNESSLWSFQQLSTTHQLPRTAADESTNVATTFVQPGDVIQTINSCDCRDLKVSHVQNMLDHSGGGGGLITVTVTRPCGDASLIQVTSIVYRDSPTPCVETQDENLSNHSPQNQVPVDSSCDHVPVEHDQAMIETGLTFGPCSGSNKFVQISRKDANGCFGQSALETGDQLLSINGLDCVDCSPDDASMLLSSKLASASRNENDICGQPQHSIVTILAHRSRRQEWTIRKAAVAAAGGSMVSVGAVIMVTPLHPIGHALALGGVGVLSTEFEGPRRVLQSAKERLQNSAVFATKTKLPSTAS